MNETNNTEQKNSVTKAKSPAAIYHLILNVLFPGLGSIIYTRFLFLVPLTLLFGTAIFMLIYLDTWAKLSAIIFFVIWWLVSFIGSIMYYIKDPWSNDKQ